MSEGKTELMTAQEVSEVLRMSVRWVLDHAVGRDGRGRRRPVIPCIRLGDRVRFRPEDIRRFIEECCR
jgi:hypothetical protein